MSKPLTDADLADAKPKDRPYKMTVGKGLLLLVMPTGAKYWRFNYRFDGKYKTLSLGVYPHVSIDDARAMRDEMKLHIMDGIDPSIRRQLERQDELEAAVEARTLNRFSITNDGTLTIRPGKRIVSMPPDDTAELRRFLNATRAVMHGENE